MKLRNYFTMLVLTFCMFILTACPANNGTIIFPDVSGIWDWTVNFTNNECDGMNGYQLVIKITQSEETGTWTSYSNSDVNFACPLETGVYTIDKDGNVSINLNNYKFDPQGCNNKTPADAIVTIQITAVVSSNTISGVQTEHWSSVSANVTNCLKTGKISAVKR